MQKIESPAMHVLNEMPFVQATPMFSKKTIAGGKQMVVWGRLRKGGHAARHAHKEEQMFWVTEGCMEVVVDGERFVCHAGSVLTVPSYVEHEATAIEDTSFVSFLSGVRKDLIGDAVPDHFRHNQEG